MRGHSSQWPASDCVISATGRIDKPKGVTIAFPKQKAFSPISDYRLYSASVPVATDENGKPFSTLVIVGREEQALFNYKRLDAKCRLVISVICQRFGLSSFSYTELKNAITEDSAIMSESTLKVKRKTLIDLGYINETDGVYQLEVNKLPRGLVKS